MIEFPSINMHIRIYIEVVVFCHWESFESLIWNAMATEQILGLQEQRSQVKTNKNLKGLGHQMKIFL